MAIAVGLTIIGSIEAVWFAKRSQEGASIVARQGAGGAPIPGAGGFTLSPTLDLSGRAGVRFSARF